MNGRIRQRKGSDKRRSTTKPASQNGHGKASRPFSKSKSVVKEQETEQIDEEIDETNTPFRKLLGSLMADNKRTKSERERRALQLIDRDLNDGVEEEEENEENSDIDEEELSEEGEAIEGEDELKEDEEEDDDSGDDKNKVTLDDDDDDSKADEVASVDRDLQSQDDESEEEIDEQEDTKQVAEPDDLKANDPFVKRRQHIVKEQKSKIQQQQTSVTLSSECVSNSEQFHSRELVMSVSGSPVLKFPKDWTHFLKPRLLDAWRRYRSKEKDNHHGQTLSPLQESLIPYILNGYVDVNFAARSLLNAGELREMYVLHIMNHLFKARDRVERHDAKIRLRLKELRSTGGSLDWSEEEQEELRDQGFVRPRVLVILPYRSSAFKFVKLMKEMFPDKSKFRNFDRFVQEFGPKIDDDEDDEDEVAWKESQISSPYSQMYKENDFANGTHPALPSPPSSSSGTAQKKKSKLYRGKEWHSTFEENAEEDFRLGITINSKKSVKIYSDFYTSDLILASPLGLRLATKQALETDAFSDDSGDDDGGDDRDAIDGEGGTKRRKRRKTKREEDVAEDIDFLSSIEILVIDEAEVFHTQNWQHLEDVCIGLNRKPKQMRDKMDFSRVYNEYLDLVSASTFARMCRQTLIFSSYSDAQINGLIKRGGYEKLGLCLNLNGMVTIRPRSYVGSSSFAPNGVTHRFKRMVDDEERFTYFSEKILPKVKTMTAAAIAERTQGGGLLIFVPTYFEFVRIRKALKLLERKLVDEQRGMGLLANSANGKKNGKKSSSDSDVSVMFECLHEYSSPQGISRARSRFYHGGVKVLVVTERFHYYYRYKLRGMNRVLFFGPPSHAMYYSDFLDMVPRSQTANSEAVTFYTELEALEMERILGSKRCGKALRSEETEFSIVSRDADIEEE